MKTLTLWHLIFICFLFACSDKNHVSSVGIANCEDRVLELKKYFNLKSNIIDTHFKIYDANLNNRSVPGATSRDYKIALKLDPSLILKWTNDVKPVKNPNDLAWANDPVITSLEGFSVSEMPQYLGNEYKQLIVYPKSGIIFLRFYQM